MRPLYTSDEMRRCDEAATAQYHIPSLLLMENAARGAVDLAEARYGPVRNRHIILLCGKGNNGGDGFAMARHLINRGAEVSVLTLGADEDSKGDAGLNLTILRHMERQDSRLCIKQIKDISLLSTVFNEHPAWIVDAMLGTGLNSPLRGLVLDCVDAINKARVPVVAVDIPTGINADTGEALGHAVMADATFTMGGLKRGLLLGQGRRHAGSVSVVDISMPQEGFAREATQTFLTEVEDVRDFLPRRSADSHKYQNGSVFILAGSTGLTGAASLASMGALRSGAGIVHLGIPASLNAILESRLTEVMTVPYRETDSGSLGMADFDAIRDRADGADAVVLGPGLSRHEETGQLVRELIRSASQPMLLDADALFALAGHTDILRKTDTPLILTPHVGEFARLVPTAKDEIEAGRIDVARDFAKDFGVTLLLKGAPTVIATQEGKVSVNPTGNPGMATAGTGDVLSGIIGGLLAQGLSPELAASIGAYLHGHAGDLVCNRLGKHGMIATDILDALPETFRMFSVPSVHDGSH
ncbi:MAG: NAD(P)H-hydrate dehydratase [Bacteroidetes bacterium]|nr:NAD(P)H-hydrate dehydratase [Bacteroidota bacterium]